MAKSKIIKELVSDEISITQALRRLTILASDIDHIDLKEWAEKELNGYEESDNIPDYRQIQSNTLIYSGIAGNLQLTEVALPLQYISEETYNKIKCVNVKESIASIENMISKGQNYLCINRSNLATEICSRTSDEIYGGIQCSKIEQRFALSQFEKIINTVKTKIINILLKLDKEFGCLDDLDIGCDKMSKKKANEVKEEINLIVNGDVNISKSQVALNDSKIDNRKTTTKNKNSNTGKGTNSVEKHTDIKTDVKIEKQEKEKKGNWFLNLFRKRSK